MSNIELHCFGASQEVGRSAFLLKTDKNILLDYGIKIFGKDEKPEYPLPISQNIDAEILSHAHMDHSGFIPYLYTFSKARWYATPPTKEMCEILWKDSMKIMGEELPYNITHFNKALKYWQPMLYGQNVPMGETNLRFLDAGHICGSAMVDIDYNGKKILYTGDFKTEETRMHKGARQVEDVNVLIVDSTYALKDHPNRKEAEKTLLEEIEETLGIGGNILFPAFSLGRSQELVSLIRSHYKDVPIYLDGMGRSLTEIYVKYSKYLKNPDEFRRHAKTINFITDPRMRKEAVKRPSVIISSAGMMEGGPVLGYLGTLNADSKIILTGYCVEGTNGWKLMNKGYVTMDGQDLEVDLPVEYKDFSAHAGRSDILNFIKHANPEKIIIVHSDSATEFEKELEEDFGYDAVAPKVGEMLEL